MRSFRIQVFETSLDGAEAVCVALSLSNDGADDVVRSYEYCERDCVDQSLSKAFDAARAYWRHGALYSEPLSSGWQ